MSSGTSPNQATSKISFDFKHVTTIIDSFGDVECCEGHGHVQEHGRIRKVHPCRHMSAY